MTIGPESVAPVLAAAGTALLALVLLRRLWRRPTTPSQRSPSEVRPDIRPALVAETAELHDIARDAVARIDTKLALLEELIRQSDARAAELRALLEQQATDQPPMAADERG